MEEFKVVPDVIPTVPPQIVNLKYDEINVTPGLELTPTQVQNQPEISWTAEKNAYYTLLFVDTDIPPNYDFKQFSHWLVVDIPANDVSAGKTLFNYIGSGPPKESGLHRYIFIVYKQPGKLDPSLLMEIKDEKLSDRGTLSFPEFIKIHNLGEPIAANFYRAKFDDFVPLLMEKLKARYNF